MAVKLIVNADDYGRSTGVSRGIREAHSRGIVTSTTCLMNFANIADDLALALEETPELGLGTHLVLTSGSPLLPPDQIRTLVDENGRFLKYIPFLENRHQLDPAQLKAEWRAQIEKFMQLSGRKPTHLDSHHHAAFWSEQLFRTILELAAEYGCAIRQMAAQPGGDPIGIPSILFDEVREFVPRLLAELSPPFPDCFYATFYDELATKEHLLHIIEYFPSQGTVELMCHPGFSDDYLLDATIYNTQRETELEVLTNPEIIRALHTRQVNLTTFAHLSKHDQPA